ncbi:uncharacterized protein CLUP02_08640 [Colletotrichum lupini]|uniref:Helicase-like protein n=3 Tax=Colletotrichum acutatum species complex TaxID=2707335 RepID=A0A9Q8SV37_9PEZI|nr:uncharacterized protein CLUP02_08640 [Colletotrichum lupini]UQC83147.1 hypothetical protein CLUP02_08640 [Colletotrichum lupini]
MPSLSLLRRGSKAHDQRPLSPSKRQPRQQQEARPPLSPPQENGREAPAGGLGIGTGEAERERKFSKRDLFGGLLSRSKGRSVSSSASTPASSTKSGRGPGAESPTKLPTRSGSRVGVGGFVLAKAGHSVSPPQSSAESRSSRSPPPLNPNKPLPSPPPFVFDSADQKANGPSAKPVLKLTKIMATLSDDDVEKLFSGAPQYFARSEGHYTGAPHPSVAFPWDESLEIRDLTDHVQIEDAAWSCITAWPHITRDMNSNPAAIRCAKERKRAHFYPRCRERPNMLSMQGLEKGTMGYQAALEMPVGDALQEEQFGFDSIGSKAKAIVEQRQRMLASKDGLRRLEESSILDQLIKNGARYKENKVHRKIHNTLYNELFLGILHPPTRVIDHHDPYSLSVQISALVKVLAAPNVWIDFSHVEWRIRLGQILWGSFEGDELETDVEIDDADSNEERKEERYWLLLQILLACELLIRLDAITEGEELGIESIRPTEIKRFEKDANSTVKWSLHLARAWLENIEIIERKVDPANTQKRNSGGWLASLTGKMSLHPNSHAHSHGDVSVYTIQGRYSERQVNGLTNFARKLRWPDIESDTYAEQISETVNKVSEATPIHTPAETPMSIDTKRSSYFGGGRTEASVTRHPSGKHKISAALHPSGWLSKSYVSGLMLPGEGLYHLIMTTLLENDKEAMSKLGPMANLCGGFVYRGKSFWSTACIIGRVLAAGAGSAQCMGWISSDITPQGHGDGWVNIDVAEVCDDMKKTGKQARLWGKTHVERESCVLGDADPSSVLPADFIIPYENNYSEPPPSLSISLTSLNLSAPVDSTRTTPTEETVMTPFSDVTRAHELYTYPASISFSVGPNGGEAKEHQFSLMKDIHFVTAHPCHPSSHVRVLRSPSSPTIQQIDVDGSGIGGVSSKPATITGHPLHKFFTYTVIHLSELLEKPDASLDTLLLNTSSVRRPSLTPTMNTTPRVLVIDCITGFKRQAPTQETPTSPILERTANGASLATTNMHLESRRRQFGSDMEVLVRAFCAEKGWNAIISRRRRGCLACAIREAGALAWKVIIRVD